MPIEFKGRDEYTYEMKEPDAECIVCKSPIRSDAKVCLECKSRQDWTRYFDVGNTSLSLLIAAFSVFALASGAAIHAVDFFGDKKRVSFTVNVDNATPHLLSLFVGNDGPGVAIVSPTVFCTVMIQPTTKKWITNPKSGEDYYYDYYMFRVVGSKSFLLRPGIHQIVELNGARINTEAIGTAMGDPTNPRSYCRVHYKDQSGRERDALADMDKVYSAIFDSSSYPRLTTPENRSK